jgi:hypothetical protein
MTRAPRLASLCVVALTFAPLACAEDAGTSLPPPPAGTPREQRLAPAPPQRAGDDASLATTTRVPYAPESLAPQAPTARSAAVDRATAANLSARRDDMPTFSVFVEGSRGKRPAQPLSLEQRFAASLDRTPPTLASRLAGNSLDTEPCTKLSSPGTPFGPAYNPFMFCP